MVVMLKVHPIGFWGGGRIGRSEAAAGAASAAAADLGGMAAAAAELGGDRGARAPERASGRRASLQLVPR